MTDSLHEQLRLEYDALPYKDQLEFLVWAFGEEIMLDVARDYLYDDEPLHTSDVVEAYEKIHNDYIVEEYQKWR